MLLMGDERIISQLCYSDIFTLTSSSILCPLARQTRADLTLFLSAG